jgi:hypothetical protein
MGADCQGDIWKKGENTMIYAEERFDVLPVGYFCKTEVKIYSRLIWLNNFKVREKDSVVRLVLSRSIYFQRLICKR